MPVNNNSILICFLTVHYSVKCHLYCWSLTFSNLVAPKEGVFFFLRALVVKSLVELKGQQLPSCLMFAITGKYRQSRFLQTASSSFTNPPSRSRRANSLTYIFIHTSFFKVYPFFQNLIFTTQFFSKVYLTFHRPNSLRHYVVIALLSAVSSARMRP